MREVAEFVRHESVQNPGEHRRPQSSGDDAREHVPAVRREREADQHGDVVDSDGSETERVKGEREQGDAHEMFAIGQRILRGIEKWRVEQVQRLVSQRVAVPIDDERVQQRVAEVRDGGGDVAGERQGERDRQEQVKGEDRRFANNLPCSRHLEPRSRQSDL